MDSVKQSLSEMSELFRTQMAEFQRELHKGGSSQTSSSSLASEFTIFKKFVMSSLEMIQRQVQFLDKELDRVEMRGRRKMLLLHGVPEDKSEDVTATVLAIASKKLKVTGLTDSCISRAHRLGRPSDKKPRPVFIKFREVAMRDKIWYAKTNLKGTGITQSEFLTRSRHAIFLKARQRFGVSKCWTKNGVIHIVASDGSHHQVESLVELDAIPAASDVHIEPPQPAPAAGKSDGKHMSSRRQWKK